jgi:hypothetical protein
VTPQFPARYATIIAVDPARDVSRPLILQTLDVTRHYGAWATGGSCRIRVFETSGRVPVVVCTQLEHRPGWCVSTNVESLAITVVGRHLPHRLEEDEPVVWLEHYPSHEGRRRRGAGRLDVSRVTFAHWKPALGKMTGVPRPQIGEPSWEPLTAAQVGEWIGDATDLEA